MDELANILMVISAFFEAESTNVSKRVFEVLPVFRRKRLRLVTAYLPDFIRLVPVEGLLMLSLLLFVVAKKSKLFGDLS